MIKKKKPTYVKVIAIIATIISFSNLGRLSNNWNSSINYNLISLIISVLFIIAYINIASFSKWAIKLLFALLFTALIFYAFNKENLEQSIYIPIFGLIFWAIIYYKNKEHFK